MAVLHELDQEVSFLTPTLSKDTVKKLVAELIWQAFELCKNRSIKISIWKIPISIKVEKLRPFIVMIVGERPLFV